MEVPLDTRRGRLRLPAWLTQRPVLSSDALVVLASLYFACFSNARFWSAAITSPTQQWPMALALLVLLVGLHVLLLGLLLTRRTAQPLLTVIVLVTAAASHFMVKFGLYLDADMIRNVLATDRRESSELLTPSLLPPLLLALIPVLLLWRVRVRQRPLKVAVLRRGALLGGAALACVLAAVAAYQPLSALMRNQHDLRYLAAPGNWMISLARVTLAGPPGDKKPKQPIGLDAVQLPLRPAGAKPRLLVLVVGETARAQNWGLNGYARDTTPQLRQAGVINFPNTSSCGTATEVSVPCMFSPWGRANYDEAKIRGHQSLLHVLDHAGVGVVWRDNQAGCKGVCEGLPFQSVTESTDPEFCNGTRCFDGILLKDLDGALKLAKTKGGDRVLVLHMLGNHGPSYYDRYPPAFARYAPACQQADLGRCTREQIVNAYDNALTYTDHVLASAIAQLAARTDVDSALLYVSDHGESLGEKGLFLHGVPYAIAPREQTHVPMVMWFGDGFARDEGLDVQCLRQHADAPASHDNLFSSVLGLMDVKTSVYDASRDLFAPCRNKSVASK
ncbi:phosphoethanolamine transferase [Pseudoxanthomonas winnipegensis]|jgi:lipid A ethanolaminephosphotransferase|uniref:Phosphoethanolamine transferase n=1 Tax=Pseudoxanthomonas winnipegensis TaxID=2480810 RepID=A0ABY1WAY1_9GAMM|nr:phosphoethanolamine--lipid A transferase [Pseudoxanthomonas winnipegensis]TAA07664.1 phosphoethanolamine transferase [Pseudoxanthomonas winnipegensis]TAA17690.1 phosphoethanolamine transferase [Pseudoxanthomonas winnipegensis]TAH71442.1 phosphoethanolamine transferase [Pseudoxanthomonas winnipegensis]